MKKISRKIVIISILLCLSVNSFANGVKDMMQKFYYDSISIDSQIREAYSIGNVKSEDNELLVNVKDTKVLFGRKWKTVMYPNPEEIAKDISVWNILHKDDEIAILISPIIIDYKQYDDNNESVCWKNSSLRNWLNTDFLNYTFTQEEQKKIISYDETGDKVFILSESEIKEYFPQKELVSYKDGNYFDVDRYTFSYPLALSSFENVMNNLVYEDKIITAKDAYSWWTRNDNINSNAKICTASRDILDCKANKFSGVRPVICVKYDINSKSTDELGDKMTFGFFNSFRDDVLPSPVNKAWDFVVDKFLSPKRD